MAQLNELKSRIVFEKGNFSQVAQDIRNQIASIRDSASQAGKTLQNSFDGRVGEGATQGLRSLENQLSSTKRQLLAFFVGFPALKASLTDLFQAQVDVFRAQQGLKFATGDAKQAADEYAYLRRTADELGISFQTVLPQYTKLAAATKGTVLEGAQTRAIFEALSKAAVSLGMSNEDLSGSFLAIGQVVSKGKAQAEELRGQLGERLVGAMQILAKSLGITTAQLDDLLEKGKLTAEVVIPALSRSVNQLYSDTAREASAGPQAALARLQNAFFDLRASIGQSGFTEAATSALNLLRDVVDRLSPAVSAATAFLREHADAVKFLAASYLGLKIGQFISGMVAAGAAMVTNTVNATLEAAAVRGAAAASLEQARAAYAAATAEVVAAQSMARRAAAGVAVQQTLASLRVAEAAYASTLTVTGTAIAALGGPIGLITLALTAGVTAWTTWGNSAQSAANKAKQSLSDDQIKKRIEELKLQAEYGPGELGQVNSDLAAARKRYEFILTRIEAAEAKGRDVTRQRNTDLKEAQDRLTILIELEKRLKKAEQDSIQGPAQPGNGELRANAILAKGPQDPVKKAKEQLDEVRKEIKSLQADMDAGLVQISAGKMKELKEYEKYLEQVLAKAQKEGKGKPTFSSDVGLARAMLEAEKRDTESALAVTKEGLTQRKNELDDNLRDELISVTEYWRQREIIEQEGYQAEVTAAEQRKASIVKEMATVQRELVERRGEMTDADVQRAQQEMIKLNGEFVQQEARIKKATIDLLGTEGAITRERTRGLRTLEEEAAILKSQNEQRRGIFDEKTIENEVLARNSARLAKALANESQNPELRVQVEADIKFQIKEAQLRAVEDRIQAVQDRLAIKQRQIELQQQTGLIAEYQAREKLIEAQQQAAAELDQLLPKYEELNNAIGSREALQKVTELKTRISELKTPADELAVAFDNAGRSALSDALSSIITGSKSAAEAIQAMSQSIIKSFADIIARKLSEKLYESLFGGTGSELSGMLKAFINLFPGKTITPGTGYTTFGQDAADNVYAPAGATGGYVTGGRIQRFDSGGFVAGPGTETSDSIPARLSNGEFVVRAARVRELGVNFMHWVNGSNLAASRMPRFAAGGFVDASRFAAAPAAPSVSVVVTPEMANMTMRDWLEGHLARELATR